MDEQLNEELMTKSSNAFKKNSKNFGKISETFRKICIILYKHIVHIKTTYKIILADSNCFLDDTQRLKIIEICNWLSKHVVKYIYCFQIVIDNLKYSYHISHMPKQVEPIHAVVLLKNEKYGNERIPVSN